MKRVLLWLIRFYQKNISSNTAPRCKFYPTCSNYTYTAIERFGAFKGTFMGMWRILRCNPWSFGGYDAVPEKRQTKGKKKEKRERKIEIKAQPLSSKK